MHPSLFIYPFLADRAKKFSIPSLKGELQDVFPEGHCWVLSHYNPSPSSNSKNPRTNANPMKNTMTIVSRTEATIARPDSTKPRALEPSMARDIALPPRKNEISPVT